MNSVAKYLKEVIRELKKVSWPTKKQTINKTLLVVVVCFIVAVYIGGLDFIFQELMKLLIKG